MAANLERGVNRPSSQSANFRTVTRTLAVLPFITEQLRLDNMRRKRGTIDRDEQMIGRTGVSLRAVRSQPAPKNVLPPLRNRNKNIPKYSGTESAR